MFYNDIIAVNGVQYRCKAASTGNEPPNATYWEVFSTGLKFSGIWTVATVYKLNDVVTHLGQTYRALTAHTSTSNFLTDFDTSGNWERLSTGQFYRGGYADSTAYFTNDLVTTGSAPNLNLYMNIADHTSNGASITDATEVANWYLLISGQFTTSSNFLAKAFFYGTMG